MSSILEESQPIYPPAQLDTSSTITQAIREKYNFAATPKETVRRYVAEAQRIADLVPEILIDHETPKDVRVNHVHRVQGEVAQAIERSRNPCQLYQLSSAVAIDAAVSSNGHQNQDDSQTDADHEQPANKPDLNLTRRPEPITWKIIKWKNQGLPIDEAEYEQWAREFKESRMNGARDRTARIGSNATDRDDRTGFEARKKDAAAQAVKDEQSE